MEALVTQSPTSPIPLNTEHTKYFAVYTPLGKMCLNEFPMSLDLDEDDKEERKDQNEGEDQKDSKGKTPQTSHSFLSATTFTPQPPKSSIK